MECAEVRLTRSLGYGTYLFVVRDHFAPGPSAVSLSLYWDDMIARRESPGTDIEMSRWGVPNNEKAIRGQPYYIQQYRSI